ncbi:uncharacterized protein LOC123905753 [Trifolium pratense]|uniref:uncharacterized protein LOC123905753 n=1 Tax=Trifolium pratense TaxID=57577 RepID=UPI001E693F79|nr:uncharacterized protein LOC123905753 [Trifolium pratense]
MAEHRLMSDAQFKERVERRNKRLDRIDFLLEALLQKQNGSKSSFRGAMNSSQETLRQPFRSNHIFHVAESSRKFKQSMAELSRENPIAKPSTPYLDSLVANLPIIAANIDKSSTANAQRNKEIPRADEFMVQSEPKSMVNTIGDCIGKIVESPLNKALPVTTIFSSSQDLISTHFFPNEDSAISDSEHTDAINKDVMRNQGLSLHSEIPHALHFMSIGNKQASSLEPKFQLHCDKILVEHTVVPLTASIQTCLSYVRQNVPTHSPPPKPPDCALLNPLLSLELPKGVPVENHLMSPPPLKPPDHNFQLKQGEFQVTRIPAVPPLPPEPPDLCFGGVSILRPYCTSPYHAYHILRRENIFEQFHAYNYSNIILQLNSAFTQTLVELFPTFLAPRIVTPWTHLIESATLVFTTSTKHRTVGSKWNSLLEFSHYMHCYIHKFDSNLSSEPSPTAIVVPNNSANLAILIEKWLHKMKWCTSLCGNTIQLIENLQATLNADVLLHNCGVCDMSKMILDCSNYLIVGYIKTGVLERKVLLSFELVPKCWMVVMIQVDYGDFDFMRLNGGCAYCVLKLKKRDITSYSSSNVLSQFNLIHYYLWTTHLSIWLSKFNIQGNIGDSYGLCVLVEHVLFYHLCANFEGLNGENKCENEGCILDIVVTHVEYFFMSHKKFHKLFGFWLWLLGDNLIFLTTLSKKWEPGGDGYYFHAEDSLQFKQWDPGKICVVINFYNLEDKVGFKGEGIVMNPPIWIGPNKS